VNSRTMQWVQHRLNRVLLDPTASSPEVLRAPVAAPVSLHNKVIGLLDIGKMRGDEFIDQLEISLTQLGYSIRRYAKPTNVKVAPVALLHQILSEADVLVEALADCGSCTSCAIHDLNELDQRGLPGTLIATDEFRQAARAQSDALGFEPNIVWVDHPVQNRTTAELHAMATTALPRILQLIQSVPAENTAKPSSGRTGASPDVR
jgi:hypothetical protein